MKRANRRRTGTRGFFLGFCFTLLWQAGWAADALVLWRLHLRLGLPLYLSLIALGAWPLSALLATALIHWGARSADKPALTQENRNPYSADNVQMFLGVVNDTASEGPPPSEEPERTIVLVMRRRPVAQGLAQKLRDTPNLRLVFELSYANAEVTVRAHSAGVALIEAAESGGHGGTECLALCARLREEAPQCKLLLMCPERDSEVVAQTVEAKRQGCIDDFVFYDSTIDYLVSKLLSM